MQKNMGSADVFVRSLIGIAFLINIIILEPGVGGVLLFLLGAILIASAWYAYCPLYTALGICTCTCEGCCEAEKK